MWPERSRIWQLRSRPPSRTSILLYWDIDHSMIWTMVVGGTERKEYLGRNKIMAGLRGSVRDFSLNIDWTRTEGLLGARDQKVLKASLEYSKLLLQGRSLSPEISKNGIELSGSGSYEKYSDVPASQHDTIAKLNAKLEIPIAMGIKLPL